MFTMTLGYTLILTTHSIWHRIGVIINTHVIIVPKSL